MMTKKTYKKRVYTRKLRVKRITKSRKFFDNSPSLLDKQLGNNCYICGGTHKNKCKWKNKEDFASDVLLLLKAEIENDTLFISPKKPRSKNN